MCSYFTISLHFCGVKKSALRTDGLTIVRMDQWMDRRMDTPSYRDAWTHLKYADSQLSNSYVLIQNARTSY